MSSYEDKTGVKLIIIIIIIIMHMTTEELISEQYSGITNSNSSHDENFAHCSVPDLVKSTIVQYVFCTLTLWNSLSRNRHEWLRPDLKIRFSKSSNKHGTGKADDIFTEIWRDSFSPCDNSAKIPLESHAIPEGGSCCFLMGSYIWAPYPTEGALTP